MQRKKIAHGLKVQMKKFFVAVGVCLLLSGANAQASSLDELYRDIVRSDNRGYLPLFVKNRKMPDFMLDLEGFKPAKTLSPEEKTTAIKLSNDFKQRIGVAKARQEQWLRTIAAVKSNQVTPLELDDITKRVKENDPKATEVLAWMYTTGVGVSPDFIEAFNLYKKAARLNVNNAEKNALIVYKAMNEDQRRRLKNSL